jgi:hypothetical protein
MTPKAPRDGRAAIRHSTKVQATFRAVKARQFPESRIPGCGKYEFNSLHTKSQTAFGASIA